MKKLHKTIGKRVKNIPRHFTKYLYERDTIFATIWVFIFIVVLGSIPLNLGVLNPIKLGLKDFDFNDLYYSKLSNNDKIKLDNRIVIANIGNADREGLAMMIEKAATLKPKVMALDVLFWSEKDPQQDSILHAVFSRTKNLVAARMLVPGGEKGDSIYSTADHFKSAAAISAHVNLFNDSLATVRYHEPVLYDYKGEKFKSFSAAITEAYDPEAYKKLEAKGKSKILINYTRRVDKYVVLEPEDLFALEESDSVLTDKILLFGYINRDRNDVLDKFFTPMNERYYGKSIPDMNGIVVHANIISMALDKNYIKKLPSWTNLLIAVLVCWLHMSFFIRYYLESHIWFHLVAKLAQVASAIFFVWLGIYLFDQYRLKVDLKMSLVVIVLAVDVIYFYEAWAVWMHKKFKYHTVFKPHHH